MSNKNMIILDANKEYGYLGSW